MVGGTKEQAAAGDTAAATALQKAFGNLKVELPKFDSLNPSGFQEWSSEFDDKVRGMLYGRALVDLLDLALGREQKHRANKANPCLNVAALQRSDPAPEPDTPAEGGSGARTPVRLSPGNAPASVSVYDDLSTWRQPLKCSPTTFNIWRIQTHRLCPSLRGLNRP